jgi:hypothetical protein
MHIFPYYTIDISEGKCVYYTGGVHLGFNLNHFKYYLKCIRRIINNSLPWKLCNKSVYFNLGKKKS